MPKFTVITRNLDYYVRVVEAESLEDAINQRRRVYPFLVSDQLYVVEAIDPESGASLQVIRGREDDE